MVSIAVASIDIEADARLGTAEPAAMAIAMMPAAAAIADLLGSGARCCSFNSLPAVAGAAAAVPQARQQQAELRLREKLQHRERKTAASRSEEHTSELQSQFHLVCRLLLEKKKKK